MGSTFCRKVTTMDPALDEDKPFDKKKTVRVSGVSHFLLDQITKQFQGNNSTGYQDDVNRLYICPNGEDHVLVEFANDIPKNTTVKNILTINGTGMNVDRLEGRTASTKDPGSQNVSQILQTDRSEETPSTTNQTLPNRMNHNGHSNNGKPSGGKDARHNKFAENRGLTPFRETTVKLNEDLANKMNEANIEQILKEGKVERGNDGYLTGTWNAIFAAGQKIISTFQGSDQSDTSSATIDQSGASSTATNQSPQGKKPDDLFRVHPLLLRHIMAHHYHFFQMLESVSKEISFEVVSETETNLKIFASNDVDQPTFSKCTEEFIKFYQTEYPKMTQEAILIPPENEKIISEACRKFSVVIDSTQEPKITIYGEKKNVEDAKRFFKGKYGDPNPGSGPLKETAAGVDQTEKLSVNFSKNLKLVVYLGDLTKENVDAIVNPANDRLQHGGGAAGAIVKAGGRSIQDESDDIMRNRGRKPLQPGEVRITKAGRLPCKFVVHAVGPVWSNYPPNTAKQILYDAVWNSLCQASQNGVTSISIPAIGSGLYKVPIKICAEVLFDAVDTFASNARTSPIKEIRFVNIDKPTYRAFVQEMEKRYPASATREKVEAFLASNTQEQERQRQITPKSHPDRDQTTSVTYKGSKDNPRNNDNKDAGRSSSDKNPTLASYAAAAGKQPGTDIDPTSGSRGKKTKDDECPICLSEFTKKKTLDKCGHSFCTKCIDRAFKTKKQCPMCSTVYGPLKGNQPKGNMYDSFKSTSLPGFASCGTITISYRFSSGTQGPDHPHPGKPYTGTNREAYLPNNDEGRKVLRLLKKAFEQKLTFTIGQSHTTGRDDCVIWNDIHHKTSMTGGPTCYGYPDPDYLKRVTEEVAAKGITG